jgi:hypothetical protein
MRNAAMAILFGLCAACSNQAATGPTPPVVAKPPATVPDSSGVARPPTPSSPATTARESMPPSGTSGIMVLNQFDPPVPIQVSR